MQRNLIPNRNCSLVNKWTLILHALRTTCKRNSGCQLCVWDVISLCDDNWITGCAIHAFMHAVARQSLLPVTIIPPSFYNSFRDSIASKTVGTAASESSKRFISPAFLKSDIYGVDNINANHWGPIIFSYRDKSIAVIDPYLKKGNVKDRKIVQRNMGIWYQQGAIGWGFQSKLIPVLTPFNGIVVTATQRSTPNNMTQLVAALSLVCTLLTKWNCIGSQRMMILLRLISQIFASTSYDSLCKSNHWTTRSQRLRSHQNSWKWQINHIKFLSRSNWYVMNVNVVEVVNIVHEEP